jgi:hypothetical protein
MTHESIQTSRECYFPAEIELSAGSLVLDI